MEEGFQVERALREHNAWKSAHTKTYRGATSNMEPSEILEAFGEKNQVTQKLPGLRIAQQ